MKNIIYYIVLITIILSSCSRKLKYLQTEDIDNLESEYVYQPVDYKIKTKDLLIIKLKSSDSEINTLLNEIIGNTNSQGSQGGGSQGNMGNMQGNGMSNPFYLNSYEVNDTGYIRVPLLGDFLVKDLLITEINELVQKKAATVFNDIIVDVKMVSFKVHFFGEVGSPSVIYFLQPELNIYEGLTQAGGITDYGDRKKVLIVRRTDDGFKTMVADLTKRDILTSEKLYLQPNDMVYVEPVRARLFREKAQDFTFVLTTVTTTLTTIILLYTLTK